MNNKRKKCARFWDKRSEVFDEQVSLKYRGAYQKTVKRSLEFLGKEDRVLELGCGTGLATLPLSDQVKEITALDISLGMLQKAEEKAKKQKKTNIHFLQTELIELGAASKRYDAVTAYNVLLYLKKQDQVLEEIYRILKPGGIFISSTDCLKRNLSKEAVQKFWRSKLHLMPYVAFETPVGLMRKIQKHGFLVLEIVNLHKNPPNIFIVAQKLEK